MKKFSRFTHEKSFLKNISIKKTLIFIKDIIVIVLFYLDIFHFKI